jgi:hypothetical protein
MKLKFLVLLLLAGSSLFAATHVVVGVGVGAYRYGYYPAPLPPPPPVVVYAPPRPGPGYGWVNGYWYSAGPRRYWHRGYWVRPPYVREHREWPRNNGRYYRNYRRH